MMEPIETPEQLRLTLKNLLLKRPDDARPEPEGGVFTSGVLFQKWKKLLGEAPFVTPSGEARIAGADDPKVQRTVREITASPQFFLTKNGLA